MYIEILEIFVTFLIVTYTLYHGEEEQQTKQEEGPEAAEAQTVPDPDEWAPGWR